MKNRSQRCNITRPRPRHGHKYTKYKLCLSIMMAICVKQQLTTFEAQFMKKLRNTEAELKKKKTFSYKRLGLFSDSIYLVEVYLPLIFCTCTVEIVKSCIVTLKQEPNF